MTIAVMSDLHDNDACWNIMVRQLNEVKIETLINCGDTAAPATLQHMAATFAGTIHTVFGNVADRDLELKVASTLMNVVHHGDEGAIVIGDKRIGFNHYPPVAQAMARTGEFQLVCHGHSHLKRWEKMGDCIVMNPGTAGGQREYPSYALVDLVAMTVQFVEITI
jgi:putative phosphoesterase